MFPLIFYYHRLSCYSFNALAGALDADPAMSTLPVQIALDEDQLAEFAAASLARQERCLAAFSIMTCRFDDIKRLFRRLRDQWGTRITILAGGPHATACPQEVLDAGADIVFRGEAEITFPDTLRKIAEGRDVESIRLPQPPDLDKFFSFSPGRGMFGPIEITRGCAFACSYCQTSQIFGVGLRHRSVESIVRQAQALRSVNRKVVRLLSPNAFSYGSPDGRQINTQAIRDMLEALRRNLPSSAKIIFAHFPSEVRPEHVTPDTLEILKEYADNDEIVIGAQSGSPRMLDACNRAHGIESIREAVSTARKYGLKTIVDFIFGLPGETAEDLAQTMKMIDELIGMGARIHPHIFAPLPQTRFAKEKPGRISPELMAALQRLKSRRGIYGLTTCEGGQQ